MTTHNRCGWVSDYPTLLVTDTQEIKHCLTRFTRETSSAQLVAWDVSIPHVQQQIGVVLDEDAMSRLFNAVLEYELPREGGRRPDVVLLQNGVVVVTEFKGKNTILPADLDQVSAYARDLKNYHELSHDLEVVPVLVLASYSGDRTEVDGVTVLSPNLLGRFLVEQSRRKLGNPIDSLKWLDAEYLPLPSLVHAARLLFQNQPLPRIKRAESARIPEVVDLLQRICHEAAATNTKHLAGC